MVRTGRSLDFKLDHHYFTHHRGGAEMTWTAGEPNQGRLVSEHLEKVLGPARRPGAPVEGHYADVAATLQWRLEEALLQLMNRQHENTLSPYRYYAGGVAFNSVATVRSYIGRRLKRCTFGRRLAMPAWPEARRSICITRCWGTRESSQ